MRGSMYTEDYLDTAAKRPVTPGTYLHKQLRGRAKDYQGRYLRVLLTDLERRMDSGEVVKTRSLHGSDAYVRTTDPEEPI